MTEEHLQWLILNGGLEVIGYKDGEPLVSPNMKVLADIDRDTYEIFYDKALDRLRGLEAAGRLVLEYDDEEHDFIWFDANDKEMVDEDN